MMPTHAKLSCKRHWLERHSVVPETHLMPSFTLGTASGTHAQRAISVSASLAFRTNQPELRGFTPRELSMSSLTILMQTLLWPSYMNPTMSPNNAMQLTGSARHGGCYRPADPPAAAAPRSACS